MTPMTTMGLRLRFIQAWTWLLIAVLLLVRASVGENAGGSSSSGPSPNPPRVGTSKTGAPEQMPKDTQNPIEEDNLHSTETPEDDLAYVAIEPVDTRKIQKRSSYGYDDDVYDPSSYDDSFMQTLHYDPMMAWGRRKKNREDAYNVRYIPKRSDYDDSADHYYSSNEEERRRQQNPGDSSYMEANYLPYHFFHGYAKRSSPHRLRTGGIQLTKRSPPIEMGERGFHEGIFTHNFGDFSPVRRRKRDVGGKSSESELGEPPKKTNSDYASQQDSYPGFMRVVPSNHWDKRRFGMDASGFHGDTFSDGWGTFSTMRKKRPDWDSGDYYGDPFADGYGFFAPGMKRRPEMDATGFHGDTFNGGFGDFYTMKRRPEMDSSGFYGDTFSGGFGDFYTMKKRSDGGGVVVPLEARVKRETSTMPKRRPEMTSSGFYGDTFSNGFGDFYTMKRFGEQKRRPEMTSSGFYGDTFSNGFGDFYTMKKRIAQLNPQQQFLNAGPFTGIPSTSPLDRMHDDVGDEAREGTLLGTSKEQLFHKNPQHNGR